jgi:HSP20 family protein
MHDHLMGGVEMSNLVRWNPVREMVSLREAMDRLLEDSFVSTRGRVAPDGVATLALDVLENDQEIEVTASIPGVKPEEIDISVTGDMLTIKGETLEEKEKEQEGSYHLRERRWGSFSRSIRLPTMVKADKAEANFENGVLTLRLPKIEEAKTKSITIKAK